VGHLLTEKDGANDVVLRTQKEKENGCNEQSTREDYNKKTKTDCVVVVVAVVVQTDDFSPT